jgi:hypothetical protein
MTAELLRTIPIYFASTHGVYDIDDMECVETSWAAGSAEPVKTPIAEPCVETFIVPEKSFVIEAAQVGEITESEIDNDLWIIMQGKFREYFVRYLTGNISPQLEAHEFHGRMLKLLRSLTIYYPGDTVVVRNLVLEAGIDLQKKEGEQRIERIRFRGMGFYKFIADGRELKNPDTKISSSPNLYPKIPLAGQRGSGKILEKLRDDLIIEGGAYTTNERFITHVRKGFPEAFDGGIYIFSSCGELRVSSRKTRASISKVQGIVQRMQEIQEIPRLRMAAVIGDLEMEVAGAASATSTTDEPYVKNQDSQESLKDAKPWEEVNGGIPVFVKYGNSYRQYADADGELFMTKERIRELISQGVELYRPEGNGMVRYGGRRRVRRKTRKALKINRPRTRLFD